MIGHIITGLFCIFVGSIINYIGVDLILATNTYNGLMAIFNFCGGLICIIIGILFFVVFTNMAKMIIDDIEEKYDGD